MFVNQLIFTAWNRVPASTSTIVENESLFWGDVDDKTTSMLNGSVQFIVKVRDIILEPNQNWIQVIPNTLNEALEYQYQILTRLALK